jgi:tetratricopeptide (TPR) repeat protein
VIRSNATLGREIFGVIAMSSSVVEEQQADEVCASCGKAAVDDIKLKICTACKLVKYCSVECQKNHRPQHKKACKKRAAELHDDRLFTQPDGTHRGECSICCLPSPLDTNKRRINSCCCKMICLGCNYANEKREWEQGNKGKCPYCREPLPKTQEEVVQNLMKRIKANDPVALLQIGRERYVEGDYDGSFQYWTKALASGNIEAHYCLSIMYNKGEGVEKDKKKEVYHLEEAAVGGHPSARYNLGCIEHKNGRMDRASKHFIISAKLGDNNALEEVKKYFLKGAVSKDDYEAALRGHQAAVDATKSAQRDEAEKARGEGLY